ncbi:MAG: transcriptional repressor [Methylacidiphilales bacterium]|nr:transcriptional repressor [Candidatus Methylacidiphilales bacterium]
MTAPQVGQRQTRQRDSILRVLESAGGPLSVPQIHERSQKKGLKVGIATVYRTVNLLQDAGLILPVALPGGETRYEPASRGHHHHFQCRKCGRVDDLSGCLLSSAVERMLPRGYKLEGHEITLSGLCPACNRKKRAG